MPLWIAIALAVAIFVVWAMRSGPGGAAKPTKNQCAWIRVDPDSERTLQEYRCTTCGETGFGRVDRPPLECKRQIGGKQ